MKTILEKITEVIAQMVGYESARESEAPLSSLRRPSFSVAKQQILNRLKEIDECSDELDKSNKQLQLFLFVFNGKASDLILVIRTHLWQAACLNTLTRLCLTQLIQFGNYVQQNSTETPRSQLFEAEYIFLTESALSTKIATFLPQLLKIHTAMNKSVQEATEIVSSKGMAPRASASYSINGASPIPRTTSQDGGCVRFIKSLFCCCKNKKSITEDTPLTSQSLQL